MSESKQKLKRNCPVCNNSAGTFLHHQTFVLPDKHPLRNGYDVVLCKSCKFLFADSAVTQNDYDVYYSDFSKYEDNNTSTGGGGSAFDAKRLKEVARQIAARFTDKAVRILDVGCANGGILKELKERGYINVVGVDPSLVCVNYIKNELLIEAHRASLFDMPRSLGKFDVIILSHVLEHILDLKGCIGEISDFLNQNGNLYVEVPDAQRYVDFVTSPFQDFNTEHINHFTQISLDNLFTTAGFAKVLGGIKTIESAPSVPYPALFAFYSARGTQSSDLAPDPKIEDAIRRYIDNSQNVIDNINRFINDEIKREEKILVWGTGQLTMKLLAMSDLRFVQIESFVDSNPILSNKSINGIPIKHPSQLKGLNDHLKILITSTIHEHEIRLDINEKYHLNNPVLGLRDCLRFKL